MAAFSWALWNGSGLCRREGTVCDFGRASCDGRDRGGDVLGPNANVLALGLLLIVIMMVHLLVQRVPLLARHQTLRASAHARRSVAPNARH